MFQLSIPGGNLPQMETLDEVPLLVALAVREKRMSHIHRLW
jgi:hypothetical protein